MPLRTASAHRAAPLVGPAKAPALGGSVFLGMCQTTGVAFDTVCAEHKLSAVALCAFIEELQPILKAATVAPELSEALY